LRNRLFDYVVTYANVPQTVAHLPVRLWRNRGAFGAIIKTALICLIVVNYYKSTAKFWRNRRKFFATAVRLWRNCGATGATIKPALICLIVVNYCKSTAKFWRNRGATGAIGANCSQNSCAIAHSTFVQLTQIFRK
jgi:uncharacterized membrane protein YbaN (DUF454 family)